MSYPDRDAMLAAAKADARKWHRDRRERIATAALQGLVANSSRRGPSWQAAEIAIECADALIAKLDEEKGRP